MDLAALGRMISDDRAAGHRPFMVVASGGSAGCGAVDQLALLAELTAEQGLWLHVDVGFGGAAILLPELAGLQEGIHRADSIAFDVHQCIPVPLGAGLLLTRHDDILPKD